MLCLMYIYVCYIYIPVLIYDISTIIIVIVTIAVPLYNGLHCQWMWLSTFITNIYHRDVTYCYFLHAATRKISKDIHDLKQTMFSL